MFKYLTGRQGGSGVFNVDNYIFNHLIFFCKILHPLIMIITVIIIQFSFFSGLGTRTAGFL